MGKFTIIKNEKGSIFVLSLLIFTLVSSWALFSIKNSFNNYKITQDSVQKMQAYYLVEAGLEETIAQIKAGREVNSNTSSGEIGKLIIDISKTNKSSYEKIYEIKAKGIIEEVYEQVLIAKLKKYSLETPFPLTEIVIDEDEDFSVNSKILIEGDIFINGDLILNSSVVIKGNVFVKKNAYFYKPCQITGNLYVGESFEGQDLDLRGNIYLENNFTVEKLFLMGDLYIKGGIQIQNEESHIQGNVYCNNIKDSHIPITIQGEIFTEVHWPNFNMTRIKVLERKEGL